MSTASLIPTSPQANYLARSCQSVEALNIKKINFCSEPLILEAVCPKQKINETESWANTGIFN